MKLKIYSGGRVMSYLKYKTIVARSSKSRFGRLEYQFWYWLGSIARRIKRVDSNLFIAAMAIIILLAQVFIIVTAVNGQPAAKPALPIKSVPSNNLDKPIRIGEKMPDITLARIINYKTTSAKISSFQGKLLILDFWASWCGACLQTLPKADSLQRQFGSKVQFMPVTDQSENTARQYFERLNKKSPFNLPSVVGDKSLAKLFPYQTIPHYVWINAEGIVEAITGFEAITAENIEAVIRRKPVEIREKRDIIIPYDASKPLFVNNNGGTGTEILYRTMFTPFITGIGAGIVVSEANDPAYRITARNQPLGNLYQLAYTDKGYFSPNFIDVEVAQPENINTNKIGMEYEDWMPRNTFCYELMVPRHMEKQALQLMRQDLDRFIPQYSAVLENRKTRALALVRTSTEDKLKSKGGKSLTRFDAFGCSMTNFPLKRLIDQLNVVYMQRTGIPVVDKTGYTGWVDLIINAPLADVEAMNRELARYDLKFVDQNLEVQKLVIRERK